MSLIAFLIACIGVPTHKLRAVRLLPRAGVALTRAILCCAGAIRHQGSVLCFYIASMSVVLILQFSFGVAAAAVANMEHVPEKMQLIFNDRFMDFDWAYLKDFLPPACWAARTVITVPSVVNGSPHTVITFHPACSWNHTCISDPATKVKNEAAYCCDKTNQCDTSPEKRELCAATHTCVSGFLRGVAHPVAVTALLTLVLEIVAIVWACIVRGQTKAGGIFAPDRNAL